MSQVAVLFARKDSIYKQMPGCDVYDIDRDARTFQGGLPVIAHPPCRAWGRLRHFAKPRPGERELAFFAVDRIRENGGVLEHPEASQLWKEYSLPPIGQKDRFGGFSFAAPQFWWGHKARKNTWLYICGIEPGELPAFPLVLGEPAYVVCSSKRGVKNTRPKLSPAERERTPPAFAEWLFNLAQKTNT